ncbi:hypothetical protein Tco_0204171 [Tanacetum coccineum]
MKTEAHKDLKCHRRNLKAFLALCILEKSIEDTDTVGINFTLGQLKSMLIRRKAKVVDGLMPPYRSKSSNRHVNYLTLCVAKIGAEMSEVKRLITLLFKSRKHLCCWLESIQIMNPEKSRRNYQTKKGTGPQLDQTVSSKRKKTRLGVPRSESQPSTKDDEQSSKKSRKSDASASKQHPSFLYWIGRSRTQEMLSWTLDTRSDPE